MVSVGGCFDCYFWLLFTAWFGLVICVLVVRFGLRCVILWIVILVGFNSVDCYDSLLLCCWVVCVTTGCLLRCVVLLVWLCLHRLMCLRPLLGLVACSIAAWISAV